MLLRIKVKPNSKTDEIVIEADGSLKVKIKAPPIDGKANQYLLKFLSKILELSKSKVSLIKGETSSFKILEIDADENYVREKLMAGK